MAFWLLGFLASWLLGCFWAFRLFAGLCGFWWPFGFSHPLHSQFLFGRWRFAFCGFLLVCAAFGGLLAFRILCIPSSSSAGGVLPFAAFRWFMRLLAAFNGFGFSHPSGFLAFAPFHWFLDLASRIISITTTLFESSLLRTSTHPLLFRLFAEKLHPYLNQVFFKNHGGVAASPPLLFRFLAEIELHPCFNHNLFSERPISRENVAKYDILGNPCNACMSVCISSSIIGEGTPANPPAAF